MDVCKKEIHWGMVGSRKYICLFDISKVNALLCMQILNILLTKMNPELHI